MSNIFRKELIQPYSKSGAVAGTGIWVQRNDVWAMDIRPAPFYQNLPDSKSGILANDFLPNTSYVIDMWIDADSVIYNNNNVAAGFTIRYEDNTSDSTFVVTGGNKGFQHKILITPSSKTISRLDIYYYVSQPVYYRWDSYIQPIIKPSIGQNGIFNTNSIIVNNYDNASLNQGGILYSNQFYEY